MINDLIKRCGSVKKFTTKSIPEEDLEYILDAGVGTISRDEDGALLFGIIDESPLINELLRCCHNGKNISSTPVIITLCTRRMPDEEMDVEKYRLGKLKEELYNIDSNVLDILYARGHKAIVPANNMALAACERGISSCIIDQFDVYKASRVLKIPNSHLVTYLLALGFSGEPVHNESNESTCENIFHNIYDK